MNIFVLYLGTDTKDNNSNAILNAIFPIEHRIVCKKHFEALMEKIKHDEEKNGITDIIVLYWKYLADFSECPDYLSESDEDFPEPHNCPELPIKFPDKKADSNPEFPIKL